MKENLRNNLWRKTSQYLVVFLFCFKVKRDREDKKHPVTDWGVKSFLITLQEKETRVKREMGPFLHLTW